MAKYSIEDTTLTNIANAIRNEAPDTYGYDKRQYKPEDMPNAIADICYQREDRGFTDGLGKGFEDGKQEGFNMGYEEGVEIGKKSQYDEFWDAFQNNGNRTDYRYTFAYTGWNVNSFKPKHTIQPTNASYMFYCLGWSDGSETFDLKAQMETFDIIIDFSKATNLDYCFQQAKISKLGVIDLTSATSLAGMFNNTYWLSWIDKIIVSENTPGIGFFNCSATHIVFEGVLATNLSLAQANNLDKESLDSIIVCLKDYSGTGTTKTLTLHATAKGKLTESDIATITQKGWTLA